MWQRALSGSGGGISITEKELAASSNVVNTEIPVTDGKTRMVVLQNQYSQASYQSVVEIENNTYSAIGHVQYMTLSIVDGCLAYQTQGGLSTSVTKVWIAE